MSARELARSPFDYQHGGTHYRKYKIQPMQFFFENEVPYAEATAMKYILRHRDKNGIGDLRKAIHFLEMVAAHHYPGEDLYAK